MVWKAEPTVGTKNVVKMRTHSCWIETSLLWSLPFREYCFWYILLPNDKGNIKLEKRNMPIEIETVVYSRLSRFVGVRSLSKYAEDSKLNSLLGLHMPIKAEGIRDLRQLPSERWIVARRIETLLIVLTHWKEMKVLGTTPQALDLYWSQYSTSRGLFCLILIQPLLFR